MDDYMTLLEALNNYYNDIADAAEKRYEEMINMTIKGDSAELSHTAWLAGNWHGRMALIEAIRDSLNGKGDLMPWIESVKAEQNNG